MPHHKRGRPKNRRAGCLMCKPHKANGNSAPTTQEARVYSVHCDACMDTCVGRDGRLCACYGYEHDALDLSDEDLYEDFDHMVARYTGGGRIDVVPGVTLLVEAAQGTR
jgi:hypothetical protein